MMYGSKLILNGKVIWENPEGLGHAFIRLRKDRYEEWLCKELEKRAKEKHAIYEILKTRNLCGQPFCQIKDHLEELELELGMKISSEILEIIEKEIEKKS